MRSDDTRHESKAILEYLRVLIELNDSHGRTETCEADV